VKLLSAKKLYEVFSKKYSTIDLRQQWQSRYSEEIFRKFVDIADSLKIGFPILTEISMPTDFPEWIPPFEIFVFYFKKSIKFGRCFALLCSQEKMHVSGYP